MPDPSRRRAAAVIVAALAGVALAGPARSTSAAAARAVPALYTTAQATKGAKTFETQCSSCHGEHLEGGVGPALKGPNLVRLAKKTKLAIGDVFSFLSLQMPLNAPASLSHDQYVSIMAFLLKSNGYPAGSKALTYPGATNSTVVMTTYGK
ncbi:MAG: cytochrome c [Candidatus Elarobacter sp.]